MLAGSRFLANVSDIRSWRNFAGMSYVWTSTGTRATCRKHFHLLYPHIWGGKLPYSRGPDSQDPAIIGLF